MWSPTQRSQTRLSGSSSQSWKAPRHHARFEPVHGRKRGQRLLDLLRAGRPRNGRKAIPAGYRARRDLARERRRLRLPGRPCRRCRRARPSLASVRSRAPVRAASAKASPWATGSAMGCAGERSGAAKGRSSSNGAGTRRSVGPDPTPSPQKALSRVPRPCESGVRPLIPNPTISGSRNARQRKILQPAAHSPTVAPSCGARERGVCDEASRPLRFRCLLSADDGLHASRSLELTCFGRRRRSSQSQGLNRFPDPSPWPARFDPA